MEKKELIKDFLTKINSDNYRKIISTIEDGYKGLFVILKVIKNKPGEVIAGDIAAKLKISTARVAVALNNLEKKKWIKKFKSNIDGRKTVVELTSLGEKVLEKREEEIINFIDSLFINLSEKELNDFVFLLKKINN